MAVRQYTYVSKEASWARFDWVSYMASLFSTKSRTILIVLILINQVPVVRTIIKNAISMIRQAQCGEQ